MNRLVKNIVRSTTPPNIQDLWLNEGILKFYGSKGWTSIVIPVDEATEEEVVETPIIGVVGGAITLLTTDSDTYGVKNMIGYSNIDNLILAIKSKSVILMSSYVSSAYVITPLKYTTPGDSDTTISATFYVPKDSYNQEYNLVSISFTWDEDSNDYIAACTGNTIISNNAPSDDKIYGRQNGEWVEITV